MSTLLLALQKISVDWGSRCFGGEHMNNKSVRGLRFAEEALELAQACGVPQEQALELVRVVYSRPVGTRIQEVGGCAVTLLVLCDCLGIDFELALLTEVRRCLRKDPVEFMQRNKDKNDLGLTGISMYNQQEPETGNGF